MNFICEAKLFLEISKEEEVLRGGKVIICFSFFYTFSTFFFSRGKLRILQQVQWRRGVLEKDWITLLSFSFNYDIFLATISPLSAITYTSSNLRKIKEKKCFLIPPLSNLEKNVEYGKPTEKKKEIGVFLCDLRKTLKKWWNMKKKSGFLTCLPNNLEKLRRNMSNKK